MSQSDIMHHYVNLPKANDGLRRDEATFYKQVWPVLDNLRKNDKDISKFERMHYGKEIPVWRIE